MYACNNLWRPLEPITANNCIRHCVVSSLAWIVFWGCNLPGSIFLFLGITQILNKKTFLRKRLPLFKNLIYAETEKNHLTMINVDKHRLFQEPKSANSNTHHQLSYNAELTYPQSLKIRRRVSTICICTRLRMKWKQSKSYETHYSKYRNAFHKFTRTSKNLPNITMQDKRQSLNVHYMLFNNGIGESIAILHEMHGKCSFVHLQANQNVEQKTENLTFSTHVLTLVGSFHGEHRKVSNRPRSVSKQETTYECRWHSGDVCAFRW